MQSQWYTQCVGAVNTTESHTCVGLCSKTTVPSTADNRLIETTRNRCSACDSASALPLTSAKLPLTYLEALFLSAELVSLSALHHLLGTQILEEVVASVSKSAEVGIGPGSQTKHSIPGIEREREKGRKCQIETRPPDDFSVAPVDVESCRLFFCRQLDGKELILQDNFKLTTREQSANFPNVTQCLISSSMRSFVPGMLAMQAMVFVQLKHA